MGDTALRDVFVAVQQHHGNISPPGEIGGCVVVKSCLAESRNDDCEREGREGGRRE